MLIFIYFNPTANVNPPILNFPKCGKFLSINTRHEIPKLKPLFHSKVTYEVVACTCLASHSNQLSSKRARSELASSFRRCVEKRPKTHFCLQVSFYTTNVSRDLFRHVYTFTSFTILYPCLVTCLSTKFGDSKFLKWNVQTQKQQAEKMRILTLKNRIMDHGDTCKNMLHVFLLIQ